MRRRRGAKGVIIPSGGLCVWESMARRVGIATGEAQRLFSLHFLAGSQSGEPPFPERRCRAPWRLQTRSGRPVRASRRRPWSMPTTARANRTDGDAEAGAAEAEKCKKARVTLPVLSVLQTVLQDAAEALADKTKELTDVLGSINNDQLVAEPDVWLQPRPERTTRRTADGSRTAQIASHGRLTACRSRLMRYPDRADDRRASLFLRRGALCILACVVQGILCA